MEVILYQPKIPQNTGNIARTCAVSGTKLTLVRPLGFSLSRRHLRRAGLDYWDDLDLECIDSLEEKLENTDAPFFFFSSKTKKIYTEIAYSSNALLIFGSETDGLPTHLWELWEKRFATIPMKEGARCLNLATSVGIVLYEGLRQQRAY